MKTKYPIVLVHGMAMKRTFYMKPFGRIGRILRVQGYKVYESEIDSMGTIESNAEQLRCEIRDILEKEQTEKVNLIAHSKGGLDARYMIESLDMAPAVASLTTLCTPHRGSPIASFVLRFPRFLLRYVAFFVNLWFRLVGDRNPDSLGSCMQLRRVNDDPEGAARPVEGVFCQSFSASIRNEERHRDFIMGIPAAFSRMMEKNVETDGMVPRDSAIFGTYRGDCIDGSVSHTEIVDFMVRDRYKDRIYAFYSALCEELAGMGL